jgi:4-amino-4-deoxychorismate lyase
MAPAVEVLSSATCIARLGASYAQPQQTALLAFYSSALGGITTDPVFMAVPIDDHFAHRGHAVFDTCNLTGDGRCYGLSFHLDRLLQSARQARIPAYAPKARLREIVLHTMAAAGRGRGAGVRFWMTAGRGDFAISPHDTKGPGFYVVVHAADDAARARAKREGVAEVIVRDVPLKPPVLATLKSSNYLVNALAAMRARDGGGALGIQLDARGNLAEASIGSVGVVDAAGLLRTPKLDIILRGTTLLRAHELWHGLPPAERRASGLTGFEFADVSPEDAARAVEVIGFGGAHVSAVVRLDGRAVGDGRPGRAFRALDRLLTRDMESGEFLDDVPYAAVAAEAAAQAKL